MLAKRYNYDGKASIFLSKKQAEAKRQCFKKLREEYRLINVDCECGENDYAVLSKKDRYGLPVTIVICKKCGLVYQNPQLDDTSSKDFYCYIYRKLHDRSTVEEYFDFQFNRGNRIVNWLHENNCFPKRVVEIGCGAGGILKAFQNIGAETLGVDFGENYVKYGRSKGLHLEIGGIEKIPQHQADLVILSHVLEHNSNIEQEISSIEKLLLPQGYAYIEVPGALNFQQFSYDFLKSIEISHNYYFTLGTLEQILNSYGWKLERGNENIYSLSKYTGHRSKISKNYYPEIRSNLDYFEKMRHIGQLKSTLSINRLTQIGVRVARFFGN